MPTDPKLVRDHFVAAAELPAAERGAYLAAHCGGDAEFRAAVERLLAVYDQSAKALNPPAPAGMGQTQLFAFSEQPGTVVAGRYKLLEAIGEGGMGTVWVAEQSQPIRRKVALKLIKAGMDSKNVLARFEAERQALAVMDHPNIARVLDGGLTEAGRPFFVMEYVKGVPITEYCDGTRMSVADRLSLFVQVCHAVQHAHQKGIIHRDLKPSNILVAPYDDKPVTKVIDFGLAKAMHQPLTERTLHTAHETVLGTPLYMSPEQAQFNNLDVDTRSDIYSLGVLLYELLTGTTPVEKKRFKLAAWDEIRRIIRDEEPPRPSTRLSSVETLPSLAAGRQTDPARLTKLMRGELDWIVMKSLEKDRARRYQTANGFAMDIQRYLSGETVLAAPPSVRYQLRKFGRKYRVGLIATAVILLLLGSSAVAVMSVQARSNRALAAKTVELAAEQAKVEAQFKELVEEKTKVQSRLKLAQDSIAMFHTGVSEDMLLKNYQLKELRDKLLTQAALFYGEMAKLLEGESDAESRRALGDGYFQVGDLTDKIGSKAKALDIHRKALAVRRELAAETGADVETQLDVARSLAAVGSLLRRTGDSAGARAAFEEQRQLAEGLAAKDSTNAALTVKAQSYIDLGILLGPKELGQPKESVEALKNALAIHQKLADSNPRDSQFQYKLASNHREIGRILLQWSKFEEAIPEIEKARNIFQALANADATIADYRSNLARCQNNLGAAYLSRKKPDDAKTAYETALAIYKKLVSENSAVTQLQHAMATGHINVGFVSRQTGKPKQAMESYDEGRKVLQKLVDDNLADADVQKSLAWSLDEIGWLLSQTGHPEDAITYYTQEEAVLRQLATAKTAVPDDRETLANCLTNSADALRRSRKLPEARRACDNAKDLRKQLVIEVPSNPLYSGNLGETYLRAGQVRNDEDDLNGAKTEWNEAIKLYAGLAAPHTEQLFFRACCHAGLSGLATKPGSGVSVDEGSAESDRAMDWLRQVVNAGYTNADAFRTESALDPLRGRDDFKKLMAQVNAKIDQK